jgi:hypothetical protein
MKSNRISPRRNRPPAPPSLTGPEFAQLTLEKPRFINSELKLTARKKPGGERIEPTLAWGERWIGRDDWEEIIGEDAVAWAQALSPEVTPVAWVCRLNSDEHTGFLAFVARRGAAPFRVVDAAGLSVDRDGGGSILSLGGGPTCRRPINFGKTAGQAEEAKRKAS